MKKNPVIAVAGATGIVGQEIVGILSDQQVPFSELQLLASQESAGEMYKIGEDEVVVKVLDEHSFADVDLVIFATPADVAAKLVPAARAAGCMVIDTSVFSSLDPAVPLIIPEVNFGVVKCAEGVIACPSPASIQLATILNYVHQAAGLERVVVSTYHAVSSAGQFALDELWDQTRAIFNQKELEMNEFQHQIAFNCIPQVDVLLEDGRTKEEVRIVNETRRILNLPSLRMSATAVRVPVLHGLAESVNVETERELTPDLLSSVLARAAGVQVSHGAAEYPMHIAVAGTDEIHVGRIRADDSVTHGLNMWILADNIRKGSALNAVQIAALLIKKFGV